MTWYAISQTQDELELPGMCFHSNSLQPFRSLDRFENTVGTGSETMHHEPLTYRSQRDDSAAKTTDALSPNQVLIARTHIIAHNFM